MWCIYHVMCVVCTPFLVHVTYTAGLSLVHTGSDRASTCVSLDTKWRSELGIPQTRVQTPATDNRRGVWSSADILKSRSWREI